MSGSIGRWLVAGVALCAFSGMALAQAPPVGDAKRGSQLAYTCLGCHGIPNYRNSYPAFRVPKLRGQHADYLVVSLQAYRSSERSHGTMHAHAVSMSDQDMADVAAYIGGPAITADPNRKAIGTPPQSAQVCVSCHGNDGVGIAPLYPTLAGQHADYLEHSLLAYKKGGRKNAIMAAFVGTLSDADIRALSVYYAAQKPALDVAPKRITRFSAR